MLLWQTTATRVQKGTEKGDTPPCFLLGSPFNEVKDEQRASGFSESLQAQLFAENYWLMLLWSLAKSLYLIFFSLPSQFFNQSELFVRL